MRGEDVSDDWELSDKDWEEDQYKTYNEDVMRDRVEQSIDKVGPPTLIHIFYSDATEGTESNEYYK